MKKWMQESVTYDADYTRRLADNYDKLLKECSELRGERNNLLLRVKDLTSKLKKAEELEECLHRGIEEQMNVHNETRRKYAEALKELIEMREKLAGGMLNERNGLARTGDGDADKELAEKAVRNVVW